MQVCRICSNTKSNLYFDVREMMYGSREKFEYFQCSKCGCLQIENIPNDIAKHKKYYYKYCTLPKNLKSPMVIIIFGNKVCQILWSNQSFGFVLESKEIKDSFMKYFDYFWKDPW